MKGQTSFSISSSESQEQMFSFDENDKETVKKIKTYFKKKLNAEKKKRRKERKNLQDRINELQQQRFDSTGGEEMYKMYLQQNDKCSHLEEEK